MKTYDITCPVCGHLNKNLYLEETKGWMECEKCLSASRDKRFIRKIVFSPASVTRFAMKTAKA